MSPSRRLLAPGVTLVALVVLVAGLTVTWSPSAASASAAPAAAGTTRTTTTRHALSIGTERRTYLVTAPVAPHRGAPLVVALHGLGGSAARFRRSTGWDRVARTAGAVVVYADSFEAGWRSGPGQGADVRFLSVLARQVVARRGLDPRRVYVVGHSSGAFMAYRMACDRARLVAAIGPVAGAPVADCAQRPSRPVPVVAVHGTADRVVPYAGGELDIPGMPATGITVPSARETARRWVRHDRCAPRPRTRSEDGVVTRTWEPCARAARVRLVTLRGWGHDYPRTRDGAPADATLTSWQFLRRHRLPGRA